MKKILLIVSIIALWFGVVYVIEYVTQELQSNISEDEIIVGDKYLFSYDYEEDDPFKKPMIDTVVVLEIQGDYVLYKYVNYHYNISSKIDYFRRIAKTIIKPKIINNEDN